MKIPPEMEVTPRYELLDACTLFSLLKLFRLFTLFTLLRDSMYRALSYSARLDQPAAGKVLETANGGCLVDQKSGTENYKWSVRGKGMETWPKAFSKYHF